MQPQAVQGDIPIVLLERLSLLRFLLSKLGVLQVGALITHLKETHFHNLHIMKRVTSVAPFASHT